MASELSTLYILLKRDLTLAYRHRSELANPLLFFVIVVSLFPLGISSESKDFNITIK
jgi:heme exporter protein B